jgi:tetratricopeptide (TPR) repeat protein
MMKQVCMTLFVLLVVSMGLFASVLDQADALYWHDEYDEAKTLLSQSLATATDSQMKAELLWRLSRVTLAMGDEREVEGASDDELFAIYEEAERYAMQSLDLRELPMAIVYKASSVGRWGETKGPLNALSKAKPMRDDFTHLIDELGITDNTISWYVLGQLYFQLPGWPISFGDLNTAISYTRKAVDTIPDTVLYPGHFKALATMLWKRDWSASKRNSELKKMEKDWKKEAGRSVVEQHRYYEGSQGPKAIPFYSPVALNAMSDRQEAGMILKYAVAKYDVWPFHSRADTRNRDEIEDLLKEYGF